MDTEALAVAKTYYAAFTGHNSLGEIPLADDLTFESPRIILNNANAFRAALESLINQVNDLHIIDQIQHGNRILTFYKLDLGMPGGPIPMAERVQVDSGKITHISLIFDSARMTSSAAKQNKVPE